MAILGIGIATGLFLVRTETVRRWLVERITQAAETSTGLRVSVGDLRVLPFQRRLELQGLAVMEVSSGEPALLVREVGIEVGWYDRRLVAERIDAIEPVLRLHLEEGRIRELRGFKASSSGGKRRKALWRALHVEDASLALIMPDGELRVDNLDIRPDGDLGRCRIQVGDLGIDKGRIHQHATDIDLKDVELGLDKVLIPSLRLEFPAMALSGYVSVIPGGDLRGDLLVQGDLSEWDFALPTKFSMEGQFSMGIRLLGTTALPLADGVVRMEDWAIVRPGKSGRRVPVWLPPLRGPWWIDAERVLHLDALSSAWSEGRLDLSATIGLGQGDLQVSLDGQDIALETLLRRCGVAPNPWVDLDLDIHAELAGQMRPFSLDGPIQFETRDFKVKGGAVSKPESETILALPLGSLDGAISIGPKDLHLRIDDIRLRKTRGRGSLDMGFGPVGPMDLRLRLGDAWLDEFAPLNDIRLGGRGLVDARIAGPLNGLEVVGRAQLHGFRVLDVPFADEAELEIATQGIKVLTLPGFQALRGETRYSGNLILDFHSPFSLETQVLVQEGRLTDLAGMFLDLPHMQARVEGTLELAGEPFALDGEARLDFTDVDLLGERFSEGSAEAVMRQGHFTLSDLHMSRMDGSQAVLARGTVGRGWAAHFDILSDGLRLEDMTNLASVTWPLEGLATVQAQVDGLLMEPLPRGRIALTKVRSWHGPVADSVVTFQSEADEGAVGVLHFNGGLLGDRGILQGTVDLDTFAYNVAGTLTRFPVHEVRPMLGAGMPFQVFTDGRFCLAGGADAEPAFSLVLDGVDMAWKENRVSAASPWHLAVSEGRLEVEGVSLQGGDTAMNLRGIVDREGNIDFRGGGSLDLAWLPAAHDSVLRGGGKANLDLILSGTTRDPDIALQVDFMDAMLKTTYFPNTFEELQGTVRVSEAGYHFENLRARVGGGSFSGNGQIRASDWIPTRYDLKGSLRGARVKYIDSLPPLVGDADLNFDGPVGALMMSGNIDVKEMVFNERIDWESWVVAIREERLTGAASEETGNYFGMDIQVDADSTGRIRNNVGNARLAANLRVVGDTSRPGVIGDVKVLPGGLAYLKEREFDITRGEMHFVDPYTFDPDLDILLETDVNSRERDYHIYTRITGPFSDWQTSSSSDPALSQADINWLLLFGATREELEAYGGLTGALAWEGVDLLGSSLGINSEIQRLGTGIFQVDRWDVVTGATQGGSGSVSSQPRLLVEKDIGAPWDLTLAAEVNVVQFGDTYVSVEKRIARRLFLKTYWSSIEKDRNLNLGGAYGWEFMFRWDLD